MFFLINLLALGGVVDFSHWDPTPLIERLELEFRDPVLLRTALTHRSFVNEYTGNEQIEHNERLEFLGDAVIEYVVTEHLYRMYKADEGRLTEMRSVIVCGENLARVARSLGLQPYILLARGQPCTDYVLACALEALIGAIDIDRGLATSRLYIDNLLLRTTREVAKADLRGPKVLLQELAQERFRFTPRYESLAEEGPAHSRVHVVAVYISDEQVGIGRGSSKKQAQTEAARVALSKVFAITV